MAYAAASLARYSAAYWINEYNDYVTNNSSPWGTISYNLGIDNFSLPNRPPTWVYADLDSLFVGGYIAVIVAAGTTGPVGLTGVVVGAAAASAGISIFGVSSWFN